MCALTFARRFRYNISELPKDGVSARADQKRWIYGLVVQSVRIYGAIPFLGALTHVAVKGLMAIPPPTSDPEQAHPYFRRLRELAMCLSRQPVSTISLKELSMGMSNDYHVAVDEGATTVRLGTAIFGARRA